LANNCSLSLSANLLFLEETNRSCGFSGDATSSRLPAGLLTVKKQNKVESDAGMEQTYHEAAANADRPGLNPTQARRPTVNKFINKMRAMYADDLSM